MRKVKLFSVGLAVLAGLSLAEVSANADQQNSNNTGDVNEVGSLVYVNTYGQSYVNDAHNVSVFKDSNGRYGIGQGTVESTAYFKINNDGTVTIWQLQDKPNTPTYKLGYNQKTVSIASLQKAENQTPAQKTTINHTVSTVKNNPAATPTQKTVAGNSNNPKLLHDSQVIDDLGWVLCQKYFGSNFNKYDFTIFKDSNGRYGTGQGTADSTLYFKINSDGKTMTVWHPVTDSNTTTATQKFTTSVIPLSSLGFPNANSSQSASSTSSATQSSSASAANASGQSTKTSSANNSATAGTNQSTAGNRQVAQKAATQINVPSSQGQQTLSYYKIAVLVYAKSFGADRIGSGQGLQLTMNKKHSRFILGEGTADSTLYFRVNQGKKTVTVWAPNGDNNAQTRNTYQISTLVEQFDATNAQQNLVNATAQALKE